MKITAYSYQRLSTKIQLTGDGQRRQHEGALAAAKEHGWTLSDLTFKDLGISAFKGANKAIGAFGSFLKLVQNGSIKKGSVLIIENPDRVSREHLNESVDLLRSLLNAGILIYTINPARLFSPDDDQATSFGNLMIWSVEAMRAHSESSQKSERVSKQKAKVREEARNGAKKLIGMYPPWLERVYTDKGKDWELKEIKERADVVRLCYQLRLEGHGVRSIIKELDKRGIKPFRETTKNWSDFGIRQWLTVPNVIGTYTPCKRVEGKKVPDGEPIENFYPAIIDRELFNKVQATFTNRKVQGRHTVNHRNIFRGLLRCSCGGTWVYRATTAQKGKYKYQDLRCGNFGTPYCSKPPIIYGRFESMIINCLSSVDWEGIFYNTQDNSNNKLRVLKDNRETIKGELVTLENELTQLESILSDLTSSQRLKKRYVALESRVEELEGELKELEEVINKTEVGAQITKENGSSFSKHTLAFNRTAAKSVEMCMKVNQRLLQELSSITIDFNPKGKLIIDVINSNNIRLFKLESNRTLNKGVILEGVTNVEFVEIYQRDGRRSESEMIQQKRPR